MLKEILALSPRGNMSTGELYHSKEAEELDLQTTTFYIHNATMGHVAWWPLLKLLSLYPLILVNSLQYT